MKRKTIVVEKEISPTTTLVVKNTKLKLDDS